MTRLRDSKSLLLRSTALLCVAALVALGSAVSASAAVTTRSSRGPTGGHTAHTGHGTASVACAGSLLKLYYDTLGPAFKKATGDAYGGPPCAGSDALAQEILSNEISPGAFLAITSQAIEELFPKHRAKFAMAIAADPLVVAYSRHSRYFTQLNEIKTGKKPLSYLFTLFTTPGFRLGRTSPPQDPQGAFFILMCDLAEKVLHLAPGEADRALGITTSLPYGSASQQYDEDALPVDIQTGIVDAGSEYLPEAIQYGLDYIVLPSTLDFASPSESSLYSTVSLKVSGVVQHGQVVYLNSTLVSPKKGTSFAPRAEAADEAFIAFMLSARARDILESVGYRLRPPVLFLAHGVKTAADALPPTILKLFHDLGGKVSTS